MSPAEKRLQGNNASIWRYRPLSLESLGLMWDWLDRRNSSGAAEESIYRGSVEAGPLVRLTSGLSSSGARLRDRDPIGLRTHIQARRCGWLHYGVHRAAHSEKSSVAAENEPFLRGQKICACVACSDIRARLQALRWQVWLVESLAVLVGSRQQDFLGIELELQFDGVLDGYTQITWPLDAVVA